MLPTRQVTFTRQFNSRTSFTHLFWVMRDSTNLITRRQHHLSQVKLPTSLFVDNKSREIADFRPSIYLFVHQSALLPVLAPLFFSVLFWMSGLTNLITKLQHHLSSKTHYKSFGKEFWKLPWPKLGTPVHHVIFLATELTDWWTWFYTWG